MMRVRLIPSVVGHPNAMFRVWGPLLALAVTCAAALPVSVAPPRAHNGTAPAVESHYTYRSVHDPNGTGKFYMGREIAQVMELTAVEWLERPERDREEQPTRLIAALKLRGGEVVADIGAGSGYLTTRLARAVGPGGRVKAVDIQPELLAVIKKKLESENIRNVDLVRGEEADPKLPEHSVDLVLMVDVYHEFAYPFEMMQAVVRSLKPGGRVVLVENRKEDPNVPVKPVHKMIAAQVIREMNAVGLRHKQTLETLPRQHMLVFEPAAPASRPARAGRVLGAPGRLQAE